MTRLRKMMLEELQRRNYSAITTRNYLRVVSHFKTARAMGAPCGFEGPNFPVGGTVSPGGWRGW